MAGADGPSDAAVRLLYAEMEKRAAAVRNALREVDDRVEGTIKINVLVLGLVTTGLSLLSRSPLPGEGVPGVSKVLFGVGLVAMILSTVAAISAYLKTDVAAGIDASSLLEGLAYDLEEERLLTELLHAYETSISRDEDVIERTARAFRFSLLALIAGIALLSIAAVGLLLVGTP